MSDNSQSIWTPEASARLTDLVSEGLSFKMIGQLMGITKGQAIGKAHRMGLTSYVPKPRKKGPRKAVLRTPGLGCQFIAGQPNWTKRGERIFCNAPRKPGSSFCCEHHAIVWYQLPPKMKNAA